MSGYTAAVLAVVAIAGAGVSYVQAADNAKKQEEAINAGIEADRLATEEQYRQINKAAMDNQAQLHTNILIDSARIAAMQSESGLQGASGNRITAEAENNSAADMATLEMNRVNSTTNARLQSVAQTNRASLQLAGIKRPSELGTALQIGGAIAGAYKPTSKPAG